jgi:hypothetical protein
MLLSRHTTYASTGVWLVIGPRHRSRKMGMITRRPPQCWSGSLSKTGSPLGDGRDRGIPGATLQSSSKMTSGPSRSNDHLTYHKPTPQIETYRELRGRMPRSPSSRRTGQETFVPNFGRDKTADIRPTTWWQPLVWRGRPQPRDILRWDLGSF